MLRAIPRAATPAANAIRHMHTCARHTAMTYTLSTPFRSSTMCASTSIARLSLSLPRLFSTAAASSPAAAADSNPTVSVPLPPMPAGGWVGPLTQHCVLRVATSSPTAAAGELLKYLHNLTTQDLYDAVDRKNGVGYTMFLNSKGRILFDAHFLPVNASSVDWMRQSVTHTAPIQKGPAALQKTELVAGPHPKPPNATKATEARGLYIIVHQSVKQIAIDHLTQYNLRRKVVIDDMSSLVDVHQVIPFSMLDTLRGAPPSAATSVPAELSSLRANSVAAFVDPRMDTLGMRVITMKGTTPSLPSTFRSVPSTFLSTYRLLLGVSSSPLELISGTSLPLEHGLVEQHGVSFEKGCYLGQELTARTHHQGVVRKKIYPVYLTTQTSTVNTPATIIGEGDAFLTAEPLQQLRAFFPFFDAESTNEAPRLPTDTPIIRTPITHTSTAATDASTPAPPVATKEVSRILSSSHNIGLAMLRTEHVEDAAHQLRAQIDANTTLPITPYNTKW